MAFRKSIKIDPVTDDIAIPIQFITEREAIGQKLTHRFHFFKGEWHLNQKEGLPWFQRILGKQDNLRLPRWILRQVVVKCPGIASVTRFEILDKRKASEGRKWELDFEATTTDASTFTSLQGEFIIDIPAGLL